MRKGRILTAIPNLVLSKVKSRARQVCYSVVTCCRVRDIARKVKCEAVPPSRCVNGQRVGRPNEKARPPRGAASRVPVLEGVRPGLVPRRECSRPSTFRAPGASSGDVVAASPGGGPDALEIPTGFKPVSGGSDADQTRPPADPRPVAIEATKPRLRAGRIGSCLSDCPARDVSFDRRWPGQ